MKKFCATPVMAMILKVSAGLAFIFFIWSIYVEIGQYTDFLKQVKDYVAANPVDTATLTKIAQQKAELIKSMATLFIGMLGIPSLLWVLADGVLLMRAMYLGDEECYDDDCCCGHDHSVEPVVEAPKIEKSAE